MILGAVVAAVLFFAGGAALRLLMGPVSLGAFAGAIEDSLNRSITGLVVRFDQVVLEWSRADGKINLIILGTKVFDVNGRIVAQAPKSDLDFDIASLLAGDFALKRFALLGVQLTAVRDAQGMLRLGFGQTEGDVDLLETIRETLQRSEGGGSLESFSIRDARLAFRDEESGIFIVSPDANFTVENVGGHMEASLDADIEISGAPARIGARATLDDNGMPRAGAAEIEGLDLAALAANSPRFAALSPYALETDAAAEFVLSEDGALVTASFEFAASGAAAPAVLGESYQVDGLRGAGRYDAATGVLALDNAEISGPRGSAKLQGELRPVWNEWALVSLAADLGAEDVRFEAPDLFVQPIVLETILVDAEYDAVQHSAQWRQIAFSGEGLAGEFSGNSTFEEGMSPALALAGTLEALPVQDALKYWPLNVGRGARSWIADNIPEGMMGPVAVTAEIPAGALAQEALPNEALTVTFPVWGATARYMGGLTPLTQVAGDAKLSGDSFEMTVTEASVGPLVVTGGSVHIPDLHTRHAPGYIKGHVEGSMTDVLTLIDMEPLGYPTRFGVDPAEVGGRAAVDLDFAVPMRRDLDVNDVGIGVRASVQDLAIPVDQKRMLERGMANITIDNEQLTAEGTADLSGVPVLFTWQEDFAPAPGTDLTTRVFVQGTLDEAARARLGLTAPDWLSGTIPTAAVFHGRRFDFESAEVRANLTQARADIRPINLDKRPGTLANGAARVYFLDEGGFDVRDLTVTGADLDIKGQLSFDGSGRLVRASLPQVRIGTTGDFNLALEAPAGKAPAWRVRGRSLDARRLVGGGNQEEEEAAAAASRPESPQPYSVDAQVENVVLREGAVLRDVTLRVAMEENERVSDFHLDAAGPGAGTITGRFVEERGRRQVSIESDQAEDFIRGFTGFASLRGGSIAIAAQFAPDPPLQGNPDGANYVGTVTLTDFTVVDQPFFARLFSSGTLDGPLRLLQGEGIAFTRLEAPFSARGKMLTFREGRASGNALGVSFQGTLDRESERLDINGSLVPVFGLNAMLGELPLVGDFLVSKEGEGIIGLTYQARGDLDEPAVVVNPLSMITPGIFRRIFEFGGAPAQQSQALPPAAPAPATEAQ